MTTETNVIKVTVDYENNAELFFQNLADAMPAIYERLVCDGDTTELTYEEWAAVRSLDGFSYGPEHAPTALVVCE